MTTAVDDKSTGPQVQLLPYQAELFHSEARMTWNNWSRQIGKSYAASARRVARGIKRKRTQVFLSAGERQVRELIGKAKEHVQRYVAAIRILERESRIGAEDYLKLEIEVEGLIRIIGLPANPDTARGYTGDILLDEFALHKDSREIWAAIYPTLMRNAGEVDICSTPKGKKNQFYELAANKSFVHSTVTIEDAVAQGLSVDVEELRQGMGNETLWRQEFLCEFLDEGQILLPYELIATCEDRKLMLDLDITALAECENDCYAGIDIGRHKHPTVIWVAEKRGDVLVTRGLITLRDRTFGDQQQVIDSIMACRCVRRCAIDATGLGMQLAEQATMQFGSRVEAITFTTAIKEEMAGALRTKFVDRLIRIPTDSDLRNDLHSVSSYTTGGGHVRYDVERNELAHADRFWAAALMVHAAGRKGSGKAEYVIRPARFATKGTRGNR